MNWIKNLKKSFVEKVKLTFKRERLSKKTRQIVCGSTVQVVTKCN